MSGLRNTIVAQGLSGSSGLFFISFGHSCCKELCLSAEQDITVVANEAVLTDTIGNIPDAASDGISDSDRFARNCWVEARIGIRRAGWMKHAKAFCD